ncbi:MAG TPA: DUF3320 domain-containing protein [Candidatus Omnitrophota bacterium]|nr:DUF3320 domain-containing protein [Candidatus Omnitrophota bacterium]HPD85271.1 DUF3320 domain-containing protein [Candidatus Omnitrophota bacterium]HRZ04228.1 DUF3320 domain-containing protein [Candidatus Omnitrophota bacterium]
MSALVEERIKRWKNKLIDLSKRNRLLNFKPTKTTTIQIVDEIPSEAYRTIVLNESVMSFLPADGDIEGDKDNTGSSSQLEIKEFQDYAQEELDTKHTDLYLQTNLGESHLDKNLFRITSIATSVMEEQGYNSLFLALGFLEWYESKDSDVKFRSPILLIPVQLNRKSVKSDYTLSFGEDAPILNPALIYMLSLDFGIDLEDISEELEQIEPREIFRKIQEAIQEFERWKVTNDIFLSLFSFTKFIMFKDLEKNMGTLIDNKVIQIICGVGREENIALDDICPLGEIEKNTKPEKTFQILDADSSQQRAILVVKKGHNLIIEGPPGTGKSQTIANMIAESLTEGKKVLFVSEKMAALEVVKNRLELAGIGDYCLELHSRKTNKKRVAEELGRVMEQRKKPDHSHNDELAKLERLRSELNRYVSDLHKIFGGLQMTPYQAIGIVNAHPDMPDLEYMFNNTKEWSKDKFDIICELFEKLSRNILNIGQPRLHPWFGTSLIELVYSDKTNLRNHFNNISRIVSELKISIDALSEISSFGDVKTISDIQELLDASEILKLSPNVASDLLKDKRWNDISADVRQAISAVQTFNTFEKKYSSQYKMTVLNENIEEILQRYKTYTSNMFFVFKFSFWKDSKVLKSHFTGKRKINLKELIKELDELFLWKKSAQQIDDFSKNGNELFGERWRGRKSSGEELQKFSEWIVKFRYHVIKNHFKDKVFESSKDKSSLEDLQTKVKNNLDEFNGVLSSINSIVKFDYKLAFSTKLCEHNDLDMIRGKLNKMSESMEEVDPWLSFQRVYQECEKEGLTEFIDVLLAKDIKPEAYVTAFKCQFLRCWLDEVFSERDRLRNFQGKNHEQLIEQFKQLDCKQIELAKVRIQHLLSGNYDSSWKGAQSSERGILEREVRKKRAHKPLRKLFKEIPHLLLSLKPCLMMSPLTVAQFLEPDLFDFDLVIFDEASQVPPQDSIGAIMRGKQIVIAGDAKQLPPTSFFQSTVLDTEDDDEFDEYIPEDLDSILDECASVGLPRTLLEWHYRSKHESLIAYSNKYYYENRLNTFPNSIDVSDTLGIKFNYFPESQYRKGGVNILEAQEVAKRVFQHFKENPDISLGVGTFSIKQKYAIEDAVEELRKNDTSLEDLFSPDRPEHFFVKNLESIQGDERDVIFISIGYGKDDSGKLPMRFGPINQLGGERRLNVLITRARRRLEIFSSIRGSDFDLTKTESEGVHLLKKYLDYAELGRSVLLQDIEYSNSSSYSDSPFEEAVYESLVRAGFKVHQQVGCSEYRIDMAIVDVELPGKYVLGIECDGANYHSSITARDRDRLRQQVLEGLGWNIYRIWSTDWFKNKKKETERLIEAIRESQKGNSKKKLNKYTSFEIKLNSASTETLSNKDRKLVDYQLTPVDSIRTSDFYYQSDEVLAQILIKIVKCEGPIFYEEAWRRLIQHWGMRSVGSRIRLKLKGLEQYCLNNKKFEKRKDFYWLNKHQELKIRNRDVNDVYKKIEYVAPEEVQEAVKYVLNMEYSIPLVSLISQTAKSLGFHRIGDDVYSYIKKAIDLLIKNEDLYEDNGNIRIK